MPADTDVIVAAIDEHKSCRRVVRKIAANKARAMPKKNLLHVLLARGLVVTNLVDLLVEGQINSSAKPQGGGVMPYKVFPCCESSS